MNTTDYAAQQKAEAIAARRTARPAWLNEHHDRQAREREARRISKEYRQGQRQAKRTAASKPCNQCGEVKPSHAYEALPSGNLRITCKDCRSARREERRQEAVAPQRAAKEAAKQAERIAERAAEEARRRKREDRKRGIRKRPLSPEQEAENAERIAYLSSLLMGTNPHERITTDQSWEATANQLQSLWHQSGEKECVSCKAIVPPTAMLPPGPANFYPGRCRSCAQAEYQEEHLRVFGRLPDGPRKIPMREGTSITVAEFARRVRERQRTSYRSDP